MFPAQMEKNCVKNIPDPDICLLLFAGYYSPPQPPPLPPPQRTHPVCLQPILPHTAQCAVQLDEDVGISAGSPHI